MQLRVRKRPLGAFVGDSALCSSRLRESPGFFTRGGVTEGIGVFGSGRLAAVAAACAVVVAYAAPSVAQAPEAPSPPAAATITRAPDGSVRIDNASLDDALQLSQLWIEQGQFQLAEQLLAQLSPVWPEDARIPMLRGMTPVPDKAR